MKMDQIVLASRNRKKIEELRTILTADFPGIGILSPDEVGLHDEIVEDGTTFEENALIKARAVLKASGGKIAGVGDDSGLAVDALDGAPGVYSARFAGTHGDDAANNALLIRKLADVPAEERTARFVCCIACALPDGREIVVRGETAGQIIFDARGEGGFGYDPYFYYAPFDKTFAELSATEKNMVSHRGKAIAKLSEALGKLKPLNPGT